MKMRLMIDRGPRSQYKDCPEYVDLGDDLASLEIQAQKNHYQSLSMLNSRGGLCPRELYAIMHGVRWPKVKAMSLRKAVDWVIQEFA